MQEVINKYSGISKVMNLVAERHWEIFVHGLSVFCLSPQIHSLPFGSLVLGNPVGFLIIEAPLTGNGEKGGEQGGDK